MVGRSPVLAYPGMRVIMNKGYKTQGTGTVISVLDKLSCSVRWDSGRTEQCLFTGKFDMFQLLEVPGAPGCSRNKNSMPTTHRSDDQRCSWNEGCTSPSVSPRKPRGTSPSMSPRVLNISPRRARTSEDDGQSVNGVRRRTRAGPSLRGYLTPGDVNKEIRCKLAKSLHSPFQKQHGSLRRDLEKTEHTHTCKAHPPKSVELSEDISPGLSHSTNTTQAQPSFLGDDWMQESWLERRGMLGGLESSKADRIISFCAAHPPLRRERSNLNNRERWSAVQVLDVRYTQNKSHSQCTTKKKQNVALVFLTRSVGQRTHTHITVLTQQTHDRRSYMACIRIACVLKCNCRILVATCRI